MKLQGFFFLFISCEMVASDKYFEIVHIPEMSERKYIKYCLPSVAELCKLLPPPFTNDDAMKLQNKVVTWPELLEQLIEMKWRYNDQTVTRIMSLTDEIVLHSKQLDPE